MKIQRSPKAGMAAMMLVVSLTVAPVAWSQSSGATEALAGPVASASGSTTIKSDRKANRALQKQIYAAIAKHKEIDAGSISAKADNGAVSINGTVLEASQIDKVTEIAKSVPGVTSVTTRLSVKRPLGQ